MTRTATLILSIAAICLTATAAQAAAPCDGSIGGHRYTTDTGLPCDGTINSHRNSDDSTPPPSSDESTGRNRKE